MKWELFVCILFTLFYHFIHPQKRCDIFMRSNTDRALLNHEKINTVLTSLHAIFVSVELFVHAVSEIIDGIYILYHFFVHTTGEPVEKKMTHNFIIYVLSNQILFLKVYNNIIRSILANKTDNIP